MLPLTGWTPPSGQARDSRPEGGKLESLHFAFGDTDVFCIVDAPDDEAVAAVGIAINGSGVVSIRTTKLLTVAHVDEALGRAVDLPIAGHLTGGGARSGPARWRNPPRRPGPLRDGMAR